MVNNSKPRTLKRANAATRRAIILLLWYDAVENRRGATSMSVRLRYAFVLVNEDRTALVRRRIDRHRHLGRRRRVHSRKVMSFVDGVVTRRAVDPGGLRLADRPSLTVCTAAEGVVTRVYL